jgi:serine/threonine protein phosphatase PrpC
VICPRCDAPVIVVDRFCESCGWPLDGADHRETDLGPVAALTDRGRFRSRNEDSYAVTAGDTGLAAVVCDGVSTTDDSAYAADAAARSALEELVAGMANGDDWGALAARAVLVAQNAVRHDNGSTTIALGLVRPGEVVVANVGDSRIYWLGDDGHHTQLSVDDSGRPHEITAWLGPDSEPVIPHVTRLDPGGNGLLVLCSDGLWNYADAPDTLAGLLPAAEQREPVGVARGLLRSALAAEGADNVTVAVIAHQGTQLSQGTGDANQ